MIKGKKIIIGITASIAAYKIPFLIRLLKKEGADVQVILTPKAVDFVTPLTLSTLSQRPVLIEPFNLTNGQWNSHVDLGNWADLIVIAPASANTIGKFANGIVDNLLLATYFAAKCPVFFAPAMDVDMFLHPVTQKNVETLQSHGNMIIAPASGELASGLFGCGRMEEPDIIYNIIEKYFKTRNDFCGKRILVTAGPTYENIDPVRFIGNHSSGLMGFSIAEEFANRGADVHLISGPSKLSANHPSISCTKVTSAKEMHNCCLDLFPKTDITIMAAAVSDYTPITVNKQKIKKSNSDLSLRLKPTIDILADLGKQKSDSQFLAGFALETENEVANAQKKIIQKNLNLILLNSLNDDGAGFAVATNKITAIDSKGNITEFDLKSKNEVAKDIADLIKQMIEKDPFAKIV